MKNIKQKLTFKLKPLGYAFLVLSLLGASSALSSIFLLSGMKGAQIFIITYSINLIGYVINLLGSVLLIREKKRGKILIQTGSSIFILGGILTVTFSPLVGITSILVAILFFIVARASK